MANPQNSFFSGLLQNCLELTGSNSKMIETDDLISWFQDCIYVETLIDITLPDCVVDMKYDLILLSGTPGSGKTQFIKKLMDHLDNEGFVQIKDSDSVQRYHKDSNTLIIKHDATQVDSEADDAAHKLGKLLAADWDNENYDRDPKNNKYLIGINKGVLQRLLNLSNFKKLSTSIKDKEDQKVLVIDLASRSAVDPSNRGDSFVLQLLGKICDDKYWEKELDCNSEFHYETCYGCELVNSSKCPILCNVQELRNSHIVGRINELFELNHCTAGQITTFRDILAILSKGIVGYHAYYDHSESPCDMIRKEVSQNQDGNFLNLFKLLFYNSFFSDEDIWGKWLGKKQSGACEGYKEDYLCGYAGPYFENNKKSIGVIAKFDPVNSSSRHLRDLDNNVYNDFVGYVEGLSYCNELERKVFGILKMRFDKLDDFNDESNDSNIVCKEWMLFCVLRNARRRSSFYDEGSLFELSKYHHSGLFFDTIKPSCGDENDELAQLSGDLILGISGLSGSTTRDKLRLNLSGRDAEVKAEIILDASGSLELDIDNNFEQYDFIESYPKSINFIITHNNHRFRPVIKLDMIGWECLMRVGGGHIKDFIGLQTPNILDSYIEGLKAQVWLQQGVILDVQGKKSNLEILVKEDRVKIR